MFEPATAFVATAVQTAPDPVAPGAASVLGSAAAAFLTTAAVGAILVAVVPDYTAERMREVLESPVESFLYGLVCLLCLLVAIVVLFVTILGIPLAILLAIAAYLSWAAGAAVAFLAIGDRLVGRRDGWAKPLLVGAAVNGALTLSGIGALLAVAVGAAGFGAVLRALL